MDLSPNYKGIVRGNVNDIVKYGQGPAGSHPSAAVYSNYHV
uniref:Uncharacterized protein n=1 Tax=Lepeophtheirus salmonis TaxID=72036 RepID=A0A0K2TII8_LEPSM